MPFNFQRLRGLVFHETFAGVLEFDVSVKAVKTVIFVAFGIWNADFWSAGTIFSMHPKTW